MLHHASLFLDESRSLRRSTIRGQEQIGPRSLANLWARYRPLRCRAKIHKIRLDLATIGSPINLGESVTQEIRRPTQHQLRHSRVDAEPNASFESPHIPFNEFWSIPPFLDADIAGQPSELHAHRKRCCGSGRYRLLAAQR